MGGWKLPVSMTMMLVFMVGMTTLAEAQNSGNTSCAQNLIPCASSINSTSPPAANCCSSIKDAVTNQLTCLCNLYNAPGVLQSFGITVAEALRISRACNVNTDLTKCNATAPSPTSVQPTPGVPGKDAAGRIGWTGFSAIFFFLASMMFY
ncbi:non-specific lipid transfer protein GPI-anchored 7-like [Carya illinoinensis]|uniref:Bifunctional inhibitor/plant lipid transfer protein/seed storage helical domain-containing protein n=1 Tax=Carya illinoinensis TaxID=32201 RepID=A0A8T1P839_CARIL|nr:non-specific lipid transfer protein GPI-anchored 7-like [Carya illinoinensis]KAG6636990.1 hypothetical protein CIPAW_11G149500 [Carya illinoinensis]KAG6688899.1 hypothetical protein I3842_11G148300 [Carya illinoinensis]